MKELNRRAMLRGLGGVLVALPALEACSKPDNKTSALRERTHAQSSALVATPARRFIAMMRPNGVDPPLWFPTGGEQDFVLGPQAAAFEVVREHLILTEGIDNRVAIDQSAAGAGNGHIEGVSSLLTGWGAHEEVKGTNTWSPLGGPSIDQMLSDFHAQNGYVGRARAIYFGEQGLAGYSGISVRQDLSYEGTFADFDVLFESNRPTTDAARENARLTKKSILDGVKADYAALSARISGEDKRRIDQHLEALRSIETRLDTLSSVECKAPSAVQPATDDERRELFNDIIVASFACDATRVAGLSFYHSGGGGPQLPHLGVLEDIHELSHQVWDHASNPGHASHALFTQYHDWFTQKTASLVQKLKAVKTPEGGTLFDDTVLFQGSELAVNHACPNMPFVILAGQATPFKTGRFVRFPLETMHTHLLTTLLNAFGHPATQVGDPKYASGQLNAALFGVT